MKFRFHRGALMDSLQTIIEINSIDELRATIAAQYPEWNTSGQITSERYGYDPRLGWNTHIVLLGCTPIGFSNEPLPK